ncbi:hypothetical protein [Lysobacter auxotrophicus]|uniref:Peptidase M61 catalytic domain-containing protein n=1 Tax=Lysobacter auxotrophicus TaxID=2992573 RepID=A0ABN6UFH1_9GAMM|nr:hypothetical protein [Lysobacter auxotrophicus]BDU15085.1 hypothetical protein LA521A_02860 [Lysobacter auxotrophicus]
MRPSRSMRIAAGLALAGAAVVGVAQAPAPDAERTLRAGDTELRVSVIGVDDARRRRQLQDWLAEVAHAQLTAFGRYPLHSARVRIEQVDREEARGDESPVPWGQTLRRGDAAVLLFVRDDASLVELRADWTAIHELSHLFHPYLGRDGRWLSEGLASYYQNVLRARAGLLSPERAWELLEAGFGRGRRESSGAPLIELSREHEGTMRVYWAGAAFWLQADVALRRDHASSLDAVLSQYSACCLRGTGEVAPAEFLSELDRLSGTTVFSANYARFVQSREFPSVDGVYRDLGITRRGDALVFGDEGRAAALRRAITAPFTATAGEGMKSAAGTPR